MEEQQAGQGAEEGRGGAFIGKTATQNLLHQHYHKKNNCNMEEASLGPQSNETHLPINTFLLISVIYEMCKNDIGGRLAGFLRYCL